MERKSRKETAFQQVWMDYAVTLVEEEEANPTSLTAARLQRLSELEKEDWTAAYVERQSFEHHWMEYARHIVAQQKQCVSQKLSVAIITPPVNQFHMELKADTIAQQPGCSELSTAQIHLPVNQVQLEVEYTGEEAVSEAKSPLSSNTQTSLDSGLDSENIMASTGETSMDSTILTYSLDDSNTTLPEVIGSLRNDVSHDLDEKINGLYQQELSMTSPSNLHVDDIINEMSTEESSVHGVSDLDEVMDKSCQDAADSTSNSHESDTDDDDSVSNLLISGLENVVEQMREMNLKHKALFELTK